MVSLNIGCKMAYFLELRLVERFIEIGLWSATFFVFVAGWTSLTIGLSFIRSDCRYL